jgi:hypothetical protein
VNEDSGKYYELLGVAPGASGRELKQAYHDMAKVWHPDRFSHDPRLQQKAQEKLKEINEAYERLTSRASAPRPRPAPAPAGSDTPPSAAARRRRPRVILTAAVFGAVFCVAFVALAPRRGQPPTAGREEARPAGEASRQDGANVTAATAAPARGQTARGKEWAGGRPAAESASDGAGGGAAGAEQGAPQLRPLPTVTVTIDAVNGLLATRDCPTVGRMTYPEGSQPRQYCNVPHKTKVAAQEQPPNGSRLKSAAKRLVSPNKWFGGEKAPRNIEARGGQQTGGAPQNR